MKRLLAVLLLVVIGAVAVVVTLQRQERPEAPGVTSNPAGFVASDVALLAATGRPQLVEVFHYG